VIYYRKINNYKDYIIDRINQIALRNEEMPYILSKMHELGARVVGLSFSLTGANGNNPIIAPRLKLLKRGFVLNKH